MALGLRGGVGWYSKYRFNQSLIQTADRLEASCHHVLVYARECFEKTRILPSKASRNCHQIRVYALGVSPHTASLCRFAVFEYNPTSLYASPIQAPPLLWARIA